VKHTLDLDLDYLDAQAKAYSDGAEAYLEAKSEGYSDQIASVLGEAEEAKQFEVYLKRNQEK